MKRRARRPPGIWLLEDGDRSRSASPLPTSPAPCGPASPTHGPRRDGRHRLIALASGADAGAVTAEFASVLPAVLAMAVLICALARGVMVSMTCQDAASAAARAAVSAGGGEAGSEAAARTVAGRDIDVEIDYDDGAVTVVTHCPVVPDPMGVLPSLVTGKAVGVLT
ncbi:pilus assembly protein [Bifidobacterium sp. MA2]|uniref:Pilus assembly protein n=1 Tax=Bifidobacterium santillanense TaxID=2809028 RepID=A0ABS5US10_9BIFI|nr:pilus assembly protein [Bifidobacterium santillanense]